ncbi:hypothetical protein ARMGADRAFT_429197 [Armillaria gallica]|uniref:Uncharacterized protein n=1 Tax=Armillaria gallica TaxID=47427 RepID=A0A2H3DA51_ARMGA|nr:hypothetical protein ARMGADRAFT_429197 [Armillaria gallica]
MSHENRPNLNGPLLFPHRHLHRVLLIFEGLPVQTRTSQSSINEIEIIFFYNNQDPMHHLRLSTKRYCQNGVLIVALAKGASSAFLFIDKWRCSILETYADVDVDLEVVFDEVCIPSSTRKTTQGTRLIASRCIWEAHLLRKSSSRYGRRA